MGENSRKSPENKETVLGAGLEDGSSVGGTYPEVEEETSNRRNKDSLMVGLEARIVG